MLTKDEKTKLKSLIKDYVQAELKVYVAEGLEARKQAVLEAASKLEIVFTHIDMEL